LQPHYKRWGLDIESVGEAVFGSPSLEEKCTVVEIQIRE
jgi:hypothetical protein